MLPSPTWPKATTRTPGASASTAAVAWLRKAGDGGDRHADVVLPGRALRLLRRRLALAQRPEGFGLSLVLRDRGVGDEAVVECASQQRLQRRLRRAVEARGELDEHEPRVRADQGGARVGQILEREPKAGGADQLERLHLPAALGLGAGQEVEGGLRALDAHEGHGAGGEQGR